MTTMTMDTARTLEPPIHVSALAAVVQDLLAGGRVRLHDRHWLLTRAATVGLNQQEYAALEALRTRLCDGSATLIAVRSTHWS